MRSSQVGCGNDWLKSYRTLRCHLYHSFSQAAVCISWYLWTFDMCYSEERAPSAPCGPPGGPAGSASCFIAPTAHRVVGHWSHWCAQGSWQCSSTFRCGSAAGLGPTAAQALGHGDMLTDLWVPSVLTSSQQPQPPAGSRPGNPRTLYSSQSNHCSVQGLFHIQQDTSAVIDTHCRKK